MISRSLILRLVVLFAVVSFAIMGVVGTALYHALDKQLSLRDDAALLTRVDQIRTLLRDVDVIELIEQKPQLFYNMLGNREALLVLRFPGEAPLVEVNPGGTPLPDIAPVAVDAPLSLQSVHHASRNDVPFISVAATAHTPYSSRDLQIVAGRLMTERARLLGTYRTEILAVSMGAALLLALFSWLVVKHGLMPLRRLAEQTLCIGVRNLSVRIDDAHVPTELAPLIGGFNTMLARLETGFNQLSQVSADMAHDLRTPIGNLLGQTEVALNQPRNNEYYEKLLVSNYEELQRLSKMANNMLFLARTEHADSSIERRPVDVREELQRIGEYFEGPADERGVALIYRCEGIDTVWADPLLLRRAVANLLANAVRYADQGSAIVLSAASGPDSCVKLSVENHGDTIPSHHLARLFDRFYRADAARVESAESSGLGLSIVRGIMLLHQGRWEASSSERVTCFSLYFPASHGAPACD